MLPTYTPKQDIYNWFLCVHIHESHDVFIQYNYLERIKIIMSSKW